MNKWSGRPQRLAGCQDAETGGNTTMWPRWRFFLAAVRDSGIITRILGRIEEKGDLWGLMGILPVAAPFAVHHYTPALLSTSANKSIVDQTLT